MTFDEHMTSSARLSVIAALVPGETLSFTDLKRATGLTDGNLHVQARRLAEVGYVEILRGQRGRRSWTRFRITEKGLAALKLHARKLQTILATKTGVIRPAAASLRKDDAQFWLRKG